MRPPNKTPALAQEWAVWSNTTRDLIQSTVRPLATGSALTHSIVAQPGEFHVAPMLHETGPAEHQYRGDVTQSTDA